jgi:predicted TIM-barrel fold metal-dependent hydrolase
MIIDAHTHRWVGDGPAAEALFQDECRQNGVSVAIVSCLLNSAYYPTSDQVRAANDHAMEFASRMGPSARWLAYINPQDEPWPSELARCVAGGAVGVKLWVSLKDAQGGLERTLAVLRHAGTLRLPVLIHTFTRTGGNLPGELTPLEFAALAAEAPETVVIAAHAAMNHRLFIGALSRRPRNAYVDVSGGFPEYGAVEALVRDVGADRILFGSDATGRSVASQLAKIVLADVSEADKDLILWRNAARVFGLHNLPEPVPPCLPNPPDLPDARTDHFCFCGRWPCFETPCPDPIELNGALQDAGIERACVGDLGSIYQSDLTEANARFIETARDCERVVPLVALNPQAPNWRRVMQSIPALVTGAIVYPNLHQWRLDDPRYAAFFSECAARRLPLWVNCALGDDRFRHEGFGRRPVSVEELKGFARTAPQNFYVFQGAGAVEPFLDEFPNDVRFRLDLSRLSDFGGQLRRVLARHGAARLVMGSEFPLRDIRAVRWVAQRIGANRDLP